MSKMIAVLKISAVAGLVASISLNVSAYEIKHGYSADEGMAYYGVCENGKELMILEKKDGSLKYEGPASKGKMKKGTDIDKAARKACGEVRKA